MASKTKKAEKASKKKKTAVVEHHEKVPEAAENIEHTLRRLNAEKERKRQENPGLYR
jgi:hypothetical protein